MRRFTRPVLPLLVALLATSVPHARGQQGPPPDDGGGPGDTGGPGGGPGGDRPPGGGGPGGPVQTQQRVLAMLNRQLETDRTAFAAIEPTIRTILQLKQAIDGSSRPERPGHPGGNDADGPADDGRPDGGPPDHDDGPNRGLSRGGGPGGNDRDDDATTGRRHGSGTTAGGLDAARPSDGGTTDGEPAKGDGIASRSKDDPVAVDLTRKRRTLRDTLRRQPRGEGDAAGMAAQVTAVRAARSKAVEALAAARTTLRAKVASPYQDAVLVAAGVLD